jgi:hypothetical protein
MNFARRVGTRRAASERSGRIHVTGMQEAAIAAARTVEIDVRLLPVIAKYQTSPDNFGSAKVNELKRIGRHLPIDAGA